MSTVQIDLPSLVLLLILALVAGLCVKYFLLEYSDRHLPPAAQPAFVRSGSIRQQLGRADDAPDIARALDTLGRYDEAVENCDNLVKRFLDHPEFHR